MTAYELIVDLRRRGVELTGRAGSLSFRAKQGVMKREDREALSLHREDVLLLLRQEAADLLTRTKGVGPPTPEGSVWSDGERLLQGKYRSIGLKPKVPPHADHSQNSVRGLERCVSAPGVNSRSSQTSGSPATARPSDFHSQYSHKSTAVVAAGLQRSTSSDGDRALELPIWDGKSLASQRLGFHVERVLSDRSGIVLWVHASSGQGSASRWIHPDRLGEFVRLHRDREFILHDVAAGFWLAAEHLFSRNEAEALNDWWSIADQGRLHDPALLDQLIKLAQADDEPRPRSLDEIAAEYVGVSRGSGPVDAAAASLRAYSVMQRLAIDLMGPYRQQIRRDAVERYGLLTETVQVKAAIALAAASRNGLRLDVARLEAAKSRLRDSVARSAETIRALPGCDRLFQTSPAGRFLGTTSGTPNLDVVELRRILLGVVDEVAADSGRSIAVPRTSSGDVSTSTKRWEAIAPSHPFMSAWAELGRASSLLRSAASLVGPVVRPNYTTLVRTGRTTARGPNIQALPRRGGLREAFVPSPGRVFLIVDYVCAELRTLAAVCEARFGSSRLAQVLRAGGDPHAHTAALFEGVEPWEFTRLRSGSPRDRERFSVLRRRAKAINFGIPGGLGAEALAVYARTNFNVAMTAAEAGELRRRLIAKVYPELGAYLSDERGPQGGTSHAPRGIATSSGRIRGVVNYTQARNTPFQGVAADAAKLAIWHLTQAGHRIVAFVHDEFVVELPKSGVDHLAEARKIELILNRAMESATPGIPSACEFALSRRWSKDARPVYSSDGRLLPWDDEVDCRPETTAVRL